jgi:hypothetical protein
LIIEHNLDVIKAADHLLILGRKVARAGKDRLRRAGFGGYQKEGLAHGAFLCRKAPLRRENGGEEGLSPSVSLGSGISRLLSGL